MTHSKGMNTTIPSEVRHLTINQVIALASSGDIDAAEFGHRALRYINLSAKGIIAAGRGEAPNAQDMVDLANLFSVLSTNLATPAMREHLSQYAR